MNNRQQTQQKSNRQIKKNERSVILKYACVFLNTLYYDIPDEACKFIKEEEYVIQSFKKGFVFHCVWVFHQY